MENRDNSIQWNIFECDAMHNILFFEKLLESSIARMFQINFSDSNIMMSIFKIAFMKTNELLL